MKLKLVVRFNHFAIDTLELEPGEYKVGRGSENDININHPSVRRHQGKIYFEGRWYYLAHNAGVPELLDDSHAVFLSSEIELATEAYTLVDAPVVKTPNPHRRREQKRERILYGAMIAVGLVAGTLITYLALRSQLRHSDPNQLLAQVRMKVVEFEKRKDPAAIEDYKKIAGYKDDDFRDNIGFCTGFLVAPNVVLTASHCLWGSDFLDIHTDVDIRTADNKKFRPKRLLGFDPVRDYLFLEVEGMDSYGHVNFAGDVKVGQTVYTLGNAHGQGIAIREGIMASETADINDPSIKYVRYSAGASPGNSGGPLLDTNGNIVALVFAATGAENYNLGTSAVDLKVGFDKFVKNTQPKDIKVVLKKLFNFNMMAFLQKQVLPYLPEYNEFPEVVQKINNVEFNFRVPMNFADVAKVMVSEIHSRSAKAVLEVEQELLDRKELVLDWKSFVNEKTPAIHPSQFDGSQNSFFLFKNRYYMKLTGFLDSPNKKDYKVYVDQFEKEKKFDFQAYGMNTELGLSEDSPSGLVYLPRTTGKVKTSIEELAQGAIYSQFLLGKKLDDDDLVSVFIKNYLKDDGVLAGTYSAFIRPQSYKNFTIRELKKATDQEDVKDGSGRTWKRFHFKVFDQIHFYIYCMQLPEAVSCAARMIAVENDFRRAQVEANFREYILGHFLENPYFWLPDALIEFMESPANAGLTSLSGIKLSKLDRGYNLHLDAFNMDFQLPPEAQTLRLQTGLFFGKNKKTQWTGYGAEWVVRAGQGQTARVCGLGVEPLGSQSIYILNVLRDSLKRLKLKDDDDKKDEIPKLWTTKGVTSLGDEVQIYGYCAPLRENPMEIGYYFVDFKKAQPRQATYKILK